MAAWWTLPLSICVPLFGSFTVATITPKPGAWYDSLNKPSWTPPPWAFPVVWTTLYALMGTASWLVWRESQFSVQNVPLGLYAAQLVLNFLWTPLFFGMHQVGWALVEIVAMWFAILVTILAFWHVSATAALLMLPYLAWVSIATALNYHIYTHNASQGVSGDVTQPLHLPQ